MDGVLDCIIAFNHCQEQQGVFARKVSKLGAESFDGLKDFVFIQFAAQAVLMAFYKLWVPCVKAVCCDLSGRRERFAQNRSGIRFNPEESMVRGCRFGVVKSTVAAPVDKDPLGDPQCVNQSACAIPIVCGRGVLGAMCLQDWVEESLLREFLCQAAVADVRVVINANYDGVANGQGRVNGLNEVIVKLFPRIWSLRIRCTKMCKIAIMLGPYGS